MNFKKFSLTIALSCSQAPSLRTTHIHDTA
jgi:hypothetical protein